MIDIHLKLTDEDSELLLETLQNTQDEGPDGYGWQSQKLSSLCAKIEQAVDIAKSHKKKD